MANYLGLWAVHPGFSIQDCGVFSPSSRRRAQKEGTGLDASLCMFGINDSDPRCCRWRMGRKMFSADLLVKVAEPLLCNKREISARRFIAKPLNRLAA